MEEADGGALGAAGPEAWRWPVAALQKALAPESGMVSKVQLLTAAGLVAAIDGVAAQVERRQDGLVERKAAAETANLTRRQWQAASHTEQEQLQHAADYGAELLDLAAEDVAQTRLVSFRRMARRRSRVDGQQEQEALPHDEQLSTATVLRQVVAQLQRLFTALERMEYMRAPETVQPAVHTFLLRRLRGAYEVVMGDEDRNSPSAVGMAVLARKPEAMGLQAVPRLGGAASAHLGMRAAWERNKAVVTWLSDVVLPEALRQLQAVERRSSRGKASREQLAARWVSEGATPAQQSGRLTHLFNTRPGVAYAVSRAAKAGEMVEGRPRLDLSALLGERPPCPLEPEQVTAMLSVPLPAPVDARTRQEVIDSVVEPVFPDPSTEPEGVAARMAEGLGEGERQAAVAAFFTTARFQRRDEVRQAVGEVLLHMPAATLSKARGDGVSTRMLVRLAATVAHGEAGAEQGPAGAGEGGALAPDAPAAAAGDADEVALGHAAEADDEVVAAPVAEAEPALDVAAGDAVDGDAEDAGEDGEAAGWGGAGSWSHSEEDSDGDDDGAEPPDWPPGSVEEEGEEGAPVEGERPEERNSRRLPRVVRLGWAESRVSAAHRMVVALTQAAVNGWAFPLRHQRARITLIPKAVNMTLEKSRQPGSWRPLALTPAMQHLYAAVALNAVQQMEKLPWRGVGVRSAHNFASPGTDAHDMVHLLASNAETALLTRQRQLWLTANDISNAFGTISRDFVQAVLRRLGVPPRLRGMFRRMYAHMALHARTAMGAVPPLPMRTGLVQGCKLSPWLFSVAMEPMARWLARPDTLGTLGSRVHVPAVEGEALVVGVYLDDVGFAAQSAAGTARGVAIVDGIGSVMGMRRNRVKSRVKVVRQNTRHGPSQRSWRGVEPDEVMKELAALGQDEVGLTPVAPGEALPMLGVRFNLDAASPDAGLVGRPWQFWQQEVKAAERQIKLLGLRLPHALAFMGWQVLARLSWEAPHRPLTTEQVKEVEDALVRVAHTAMRVGRPNISRDLLLRPLRLGGAGVADVGPRMAALHARMRMTAPGGAVQGSVHDDAARDRTRAATLPALRALAEFTRTAPLAAAAVPREPAEASQAVAAQWRHHAGLQLAVAEERREARLLRVAAGGHLPRTLFVPQMIARTAQYGIALLLTHADGEAEGEGEEEAAPVGAGEAGDDEEGGSVAASAAAASGRRSAAGSSSVGDGGGGASGSRGSSSRYNLRSSRSSGRTGSSASREGSGSSSGASGSSVAAPPAPVAAPAWWQVRRLAIRGAVLPAENCFLTSAVAQLAEGDGGEEAAAGLDGRGFMSRRGLHRAAVQRAAQVRWLALRARSCAGSMTRALAEVDLALSMEVFRSGAVPPAVARLAYKLRVGELETPSWTHRFRVGADEEDALCDCGGLVAAGDDADAAWLQSASRLTQWHIFSFCRHSAEDITRRHDDVVDVLRQELERRQEVKQGTVRVHAPEELYRADAEASVWSGIVGEPWPERPDLVVEHVNERQVTLIEVAVPYDTALSRRYADKHDKYAALVQKLQEHAISASLAVVTVGVAGYVHQRAAPELAEQLTGVVAMPLADARVLMRKASVAAVRGSHNLWRERGRRYHALALAEAGDDDDAAGDGGEQAPPAGGGGADVAEGDSDMDGSDEEDGDAGEGSSVAEGEDA